MKLILFLILCSFTAIAQDSRWIDIEWEEVKGATNYEIELFEGEADKLVTRGKYKVDTPNWSSAVPPGKYTLRMRSLDTRGVPGEWSENIPVKVRMNNPKLFQPTPRSQIASAQVEFEWSEVDGAAYYQLVIRNEKGKTVSDTTVKDIRTSIYLDELGEYSWAAYALEEGEPKRTEEDFTTLSMKSFTRVGGELEPPEVKVSIDEKVKLSWQKIRGAKAYELDYLPPNNLDKNRRFKLPGTSLAFSAKRLVEGVTTITVKSTAPGYPDSLKTVVQILRTGNSFEVQDIIQVKKTEPEKIARARQRWKDEVYVSMDLAKFKYSSIDIENDTELDQKELTAVGLNLEWMHKPKLNSLQRKTELSYLEMSSGRESGSKIRAAFLLNKEKNLGTGFLIFGGGLTYLRLPAFMGNRFENDISVEQSSSLGPQLQLGYSGSLSSYLGFQLNAAYSQQLYYLDSARSEEKPFGWMDLSAKMLYYINRSEAIFVGLDYQKWEQEWSSDKSELSGFTLSIGVKAGF